MTELKYIGKPARRVDALEKVTGKAKYIADRKLPGMLYARCLRSETPHGRIVQLDTAPALAVPGVQAVITSEDFFEHGLYGFPVKDKYMLAYQKVRYVGEAIAAVAADTPEAALAGVQAIICELEPLPAVFDPDHALDPDAPQIGPDRPDGKHPNFLDLLIVRKADPLAEWERSPVKLDQRYSVGPQEHAYIEPEGALAVPTREGGVIVYAPNQSPFVNQGNLAMVLDLPHNLVRVIQPPVGGSFGGKDDLVYETSAQVAKLALVTGKPIRMVFSREESLIASYKRDAMRMRIRLGADPDGTLRACKFEGLLDSGAYASEATFTAWRASIHAMGAYKYNACDVDIACVYTNNSYSGAFRGFGNTEVCSAIEQAIDELADAVGMDPMDFRLKNCLRLGDETAHGQVLTESVGLPECIQTARRLSDWDRKRAEYSAPRTTQHALRRGIGVAALYHGTSLGAEGSDYASSTISVEQNYSVDLTSGLTDYGQGSRTVFTLIAAEELGVRPDRIHMQRPDTDTAVESGPTVASRSTMLGGNAARIAAGNLRQTLDFAAADLLGCELHQLIRADEAYVGPTEEPVAWEQVVDHARAMGLALSAHGKWTAPQITWNHHAGRGTPYMAYHFATQVAEVEVDMRTGVVQVIGFWAVHDPGKVIFPQGAYGQLYGGIAQGLGYALMEQITYTNGYLQETNFESYLIPTSVDVPEITAQFVEAPFSAGPYGAKNIAEPAMVPAAPAILNAIAHATGRRVRDLPANLERVLLGKDLTKGGSAKACKLGLKT
ncbi:MAG: xanthine dehydrogenase family protein molybdopterin-binding subunit [Chloroflexi bacterium]|nr:xanthine dehydrogenase family protein molybdopterin-binding subunit [Chloroflexota bacterium]